LNSNKALVVYGTRWGGTTTSAEKIGDILKEEGFVVDINDAKKSELDVDP
jgi:menaquinone-dependent protoporphyrinogen IX oxidase